MVREEKNVYRRDRFIYIIWKDDTRVIGKTTRTNIISKDTNNLLIFFRYFRCHPSFLDSLDFKWTIWIYVHTYVYVLEAVSRRLFQPFVIIWTEPPQCSTLTTTELCNELLLSLFTLSFFFCPSFTRFPSPKATTLLIDYHPFIPHFPAKPNLLPFRYTFTFVSMPFLCFSFFFLLQIQLLDKISI